MSTESRVEREDGGICLSGMVGRLLIERLAACRLQRTVRHLRQYGNVVQPYELVSKLDAHLCTHRLRCGGQESQVGVSGFVTIGTGIWPLPVH